MRCEEDTTIPEKYKQTERRKFCLHFQVVVYHTACSCQVSLSCTIVEEGGCKSVINERNEW